MKEMVKNSNEQMLRKEKNMMIDIKNNRFLINIHYAFQTSKMQYVIIDYVNGGSMFDQLKKKKHFSEK